MSPQDHPLPHQPFDAQLHRLRKGRAAAHFAANAFLHVRAAEDLVERLDAVNRRFARVLTIGAAEALAPLRAGADFAVAADAHERLVPRSGGVAIAPDRPAFAPSAFDLIVAPLALAWANDLPGALIQLRAALSPDGLLLATVYGPETLRELRGALLEAEAEVTGGAALRIAPFIDLRDAAGLLQRAGFALPAADREIVTVRYGSPLRLLADLRAMGETAALTSRPPPLRRAVLARALELYQHRHALPDGRVRATFELVTLTGWAPHASQQKPLRPGSAAMRLAQALGTTELSAGEKAGNKGDASD